MRLWRSSVHALRPVPHLCCKLSKSSLVTLPRTVPVSQSVVLPWYEASCSTNTSEISVSQTTRLAPLMLVRLKRYSPSRRFSQPPPVTFNSKSLWRPPVIPNSFHVSTPGVVTLQGPVTGAWQGPVWAGAGGGGGGGGGGCAAGAGSDRVMPPPPQADNSSDGAMHSESSACRERMSMVVSSWRLARSPPVGESCRTTGGVEAPARRLRDPGTDRALRVAD